jgi:hypothetical protein
MALWFYRRLERELVGHLGEFVDDYIDTYVCSDSNTYGDTHTYADGDSDTCSYRNADTYDCLL